MFRWLKKFIPASRRYVEWRFDEQKKEYQEMEQMINQKIDTLQKSLNSHVEELSNFENLFVNYLESFKSEMEAGFEKTFVMYKEIDTSCRIEFKQKLDEMSTAYVKKITDEAQSLREEQREFKKDCRNQQEAIKDISRRIINSSNEIVWAECFHDAIKGSEWLRDQAFYPGRWAAGYQLLYVLFRILNDVKPKSILEMGLGQTTKLISQYAMSDNDVSHYVTEHDDSWIEFFSRSYTLPSNTTILKQEVTTVEYKEDDAVIAYKDFADSIRGQKFDFICIDAPIGGFAKVYARIDILSALPNCLADSFIIIIDDYNRKGEQNTIKELESILKDNSIEYSSMIYKGDKECYVIVSKDLGFVCSL